MLRLCKFLSYITAKTVRSITFFVLFFLCLWLMVDLRLIYHGGGLIGTFPAFLCTRAFFQQFISYPGGIVEYLSAFLFQLFYIGWAGALIVTIQAWLLFVCTGRILKSINAGRLCCVCFIMPLCLLIPYLRYVNYYSIMVALLAALLFVCLYLRVKLKNNTLNAVVFLVLSVILYYLAGGAFLLFAILCAIYEFFFRHRWHTGLVCLLSAVVIPYVQGVLVFNVSLPNAYASLLPLLQANPIFDSEFLIPILGSKAIYVFYLAAFITMAVVGVVRKPAGEKKPKKKTAAISSMYSSLPVLKWVVESVVLFSLAGACVLFFYDSNRKNLIEVDYYSKHKMWPEVLHAGLRSPESYYVVHAANHALYHSGQLSNRMFSRLQDVNGLFLVEKQWEHSYWMRFDVCLDLGFINIAERELLIALDLYENHPIILKRLALISMAKGDYGTVRCYLGTLSKTMFHAGWADKYLRLLKSDPDLSIDREIQHLRSVKTQNDHVFLGVSRDVYLLEMLEGNKQNQMSFEYLMAWYLLTGQLEQFMQNLNRLDDFNYSRIPRHYEEAILWYISLTKKTVDLGSHRISRETVGQFEDFNRIFNRFRHDKQTAYSQLAKKFGNSYWFYCIYRQSGMQK